MSGTTFADSVRKAIKDRGGKFIFEATGEIVEGIVETDLGHELRDMGWRLPRGWLSDVEDVGFKTRQVYHERGKVRRWFAEAPRINEATGRPWAYDSHQRRSLGNNTTIITE